MAIMHCQPLAADANGRSSDGSDESTSQCGPRYGSGSGSSSSSSGVSSGSSSNSCTMFTGCPCVSGHCPPCVSGHCPPPPPPCSTGQWRCNNGQCIRGSYRCDGGSPDWCDRHLQAALARTRHRNLHSDCSVYAGMECTLSPEGSHHGNYALPTTRCRCEWTQF